LTAAVALVTARAARGLDEDLPLLVTAFAAAGARAEIVDWDDGGVDWVRFDTALLRSAWDYAERLPEFLAWVERTAAATALQNPAPVVRWSADKHYLLALAARGLPVVTSAFAEPGQDARRVLREFLAEHPSSELVVKPAVGAGARDTRRRLAAATDEIVGHMSELLAAGRSVMLQPYFEGVDRHGETALIFIDGPFSHAIRKGPLLPPGAPAHDALFAPEEIRVRVPGADELDVAQRVLASLPFGPLLYARVDLIRDGHGAPCLLELELAEPSLFLTFAPGAAQRFAAAALARIARGAGDVGSISG
jgi:hypothetical protein